MGEILRVENLTKEYKKGVVAVNSVNFSVNEGEIFALIGPNGAGKTSTIRMISTLITPTSGDAFVDGHSIIKEPDKVRQAITYLPDEALFLSAGHFHAAARQAVPPVPSVRL